MLRVFIYICTYIYYIQFASSSACEILHTSFPIGMNLHFQQLISISFRLFSLSKCRWGRSKGAKAVGGWAGDLDLDDDGSHLFNMRQHYPLLWRFCISVPYELARHPKGSLLKSRLVRTALAGAIPT